MEINRALRRANWGRVSDGDEIKVKVGVEFYRPQGRVTLQVYEVDPDYTLSRWKKERERVVAALRTEGVFENNRRLRLSAAGGKEGGDKERQRGPTHHAVPSQPFMSPSLSQTAPGRTARPAYRCGPS